MGGHVFICYAREDAAFTLGSVVHGRVVRSAFLLRQRFRV
jgi:hypothetical protein